MVEVKVISYNVHSCVGSDEVYSVDRIAQVLAGERPTVVCLQEIESNQSHQRTRIWSSAHPHNQPNEIAARLDLEHCRFAPAIHSVASSRTRETHDSVCGAGGGFGIATLSKYPILEARQHGYARYGRKTLRNALACLISLPDGAKVWVVNTHLGCHWGGEQYQQAKELLRFVHDLPDSTAGDNVAGVVLCGDFNSPPFFRCIQKVKAGGLVDTWEKRGVGPSGCTFPAVGKMPGLGFCFCCRNRPVLRLDYIFMKGQKDHLLSKCTYVAKGGEQIDMAASDHLPICGMFEITPI